MDCKIFDLFAKIYLHVTDKPDHLIQSALTSFNFPELEKKYGLKDLAELEKKVDKIINDNYDKIEDIKILLELLIYIDYVTQSKVEKFKLLKKDYLNTMYKDKIQLCIKNNTLTTRMSGAYPSITSHFKSIIPILKKTSLLYELKNYYINNESNTIKIALIPHDINEKNKLLESINKAALSMVNIILCSEYSGDEAIDDEIYNIICNYPNIYIVFCPSYKKDKSNTSKIYFNENNLIDETSYSKHFIYTEGGIKKEEIEIEKVAFSLFHIENIGIVSMVICKDFFSNYTTDIIDNAQIDLMLVMSRTKNYSEFINKFDYVNSRKRVSILCNCCTTAKESSFKSPFLIGNYVKETKEGNACHENVDISCDYQCEKYNSCFLEIELKKDGKLLKINNKKHVLE